MGNSADHAAREAAETPPAPAVVPAAPPVAEGVVPDVTIPAVPAVVAPPPEAVTAPEASPAPVDPPSSAPAVASAGAGEREVFRVVAASLRETGNEVARLVAELPDDRARQAFWKVVAGFGLVADLLDGIAAE